MTNLEVVQELYRAFREKDYAAFQLICTPDLKWIQNEGFPGGATYQSAEAVIEGVFKSNDERWDDFSFHIEQYLDAGDSVIVLGAYVGCHRHQKSRFVLWQRIFISWLMVRYLASKCLQTQRRFGMQWVSKRYK